MKQRKKSLGIWIFLLLLFWGQWIVPVKASGPELRDVDMQMLGGQIRTITPMGLRMIGCIKKSYLQELESSGAVVEYGMVLLPKTYLGEQELELDRKYLYNGAVYKPAKVTAVKKFSEDDDRIYFTAVLANLPSAANSKTATSFPPFTWTPFSFCRDGRFGPRRGSSASSRPFSTSIPMVG